MDECSRRDEVASVASGVVRRQVYESERKEGKAGDSCREIRVFIFNDLTILPLRL
ncbi:hypothetical protein LINPERPRIM_LOCUS23495 [Linum perenne]